MAMLPPCPGTLKGHCPRSNPTLLRETETDWTFGCSTCSSIWVVTKPQGWRRVRMQQEAESKRDRGNRAMQGGRIIVT